MGTLGKLKNLRGRSPVCRPVTREVSKRADFGGGAFKISTIIVTDTCTWCRKTRLADGNLRVTVFAHCRFRRRYPLFS